MKQLRLLVTGANGQLGMELRQLAPAYSFMEFYFVSKNELPIEDELAVSDFFSKHKFDWCINCAAYTSVDKAETEQEKAFIVNATAPGILATQCRLNNVQLVHISTDYVFDGKSSSPLSETSPVNPLSIYGASKLAGERLVLENNPGSIIIRTSWVYSRFGKNFVKTMIALMKERPLLKVVSDQTGSPTYAADLAEAILTIIQSPKIKPGIFHFSNEGIISWYDFAVAIKRELGAACEILPIPSSEYPTPAARPTYAVMEKSKINYVYNIVPKPWKESLHKCISLIAENENV